MLAKTWSAAIVGINAFPVEVEIHATERGEQTIVSIVGLPDAAVKESKDRVRSALQSSGFAHPRGATVVNLAPADLKKEGGAFDLPIALGMLAATGVIDRQLLAKTAIVGELALDGSVRPVRGALPVAMKISSKMKSIPCWFLIEMPKRLPWRPEIFRLFLSIICVTPWRFSRKAIFSLIKRACRITFTITRLILLILTR